MSRQSKRKLDASPALAALAARFEPDHRRINATKRAEPPAGLIPPAGGSADSADDDEEAAR